MDAKWVTVADTLRGGITTGETCGELPSETALMGTHGVSRSTVRRALAQLVSEGLIESSQGSPHRVRADRRWCWPMHSWESRDRHRPDADAWDVAVLEQGATPGTRVTVAVEAPPPLVAQALRLDPGGLTVVRRRVRLINGQPHQLADSYFPYDLVRDHPMFMQPSPIAAAGGMLAASGMPQATLTDRIEARMPTPDETRVLKMPPGTPLIVHHRTGYLTDGTPVRHMVTRMAASQVEITYEIPA